MTNHHTKTEIHILHNILTDKAKKNSNKITLTPPPTTEIYTLSLHDALPIWGSSFDASHDASSLDRGLQLRRLRCGRSRDRKSTRLNSSHGYISYAVFCLKKKNW